MHALPIIILSLTSVLKVLSQTPSVVEEFNSSNSPITNDNILYQMGSHGLSLRPVGKARIFHSSWDHIIKITFPHMSDSSWNPPLLDCLKLFPGYQSQLKSDNIW